MFHYIISRFFFVRTQHSCVSTHGSAVVPITFPLSHYFFSASIYSLGYFGGDLVLSAIVPVSDSRYLFVCSCVVPPTSVLRDGPCSVWSSCRCYLVHCARYLPESWTSGALVSSMAVPRFVCIFSEVVDDVIFLNMTCHYGFSAYTLTVHVLVFCCSPIMLFMFRVLCTSRRSLPVSAAGSYLSQSFPLSLALRI